MSKSPTDIRIDQLRQENRELKNKCDRIKTAYIETLEIIQKEYRDRITFKQKCELSDMIKELRLM